MGSQKMTKILLAAGGAVAVGALAYLLLKKEDKEAEADAGSQKREAAVSLGGLSPDKITREQVLQILEEIVKSQDHMKGYMKELSVEIARDNLDLNQTYRRVKQAQPVDPLDKHGLSMASFDSLLEKHQGDQGVREAIARIMGAPNPSSCQSEKVQSITVKTIMEVHKFMSEELDRLVKDFQALPNKDGYDAKLLAVVAQALVGSKIEAKFKLTSEDIESAVMVYHAMLATDQDFAAINIKIQQTMGKLMGQDSAPS